MAQVLPHGKVAQDTANIILAAFWPASAGVISDHCLGTLLVQTA